jgi:hypothetical protein
VWNVINTLGLGGWIIGAVCFMALLYERDANKAREKKEAAEKRKSEENKISGEKGARVNGLISKRTTTDYLR